MRAMSAFWILLGRELRARRPLLLVSPVFGLLVLVVVQLPGARSPHPELVRGAAAAVAAGLWGIALALGLGASVVAGDLREGRLAFDFRLPASAAAIGAARLLAGLICTLAGPALVLAIPALFGADLSFVAGRLLLAQLALVLLFVLAHGGTVEALRSERLGGASFRVTLPEAEVGRRLAIEAARGENR